MWNKLKLFFKRLFLFFWVDELLERFNNLNKFEEELLQLLKEKTNENVSTLQLIARRAKRFFLYDSQGRGWILTNADFIDSTISYNVIKKLMRIKIKNDRREIITFLYDWQKMIDSKADTADHEKIIAAENTLKTAASGKDPKGLIMMLQKKITITLIHMINKFDMMESYTLQIHLITSLVDEIIRINDLEHQQKIKNAAN